MMENDNSLNSICYHFTNSKDAQWFKTFSSLDCYTDKLQLIRDSYDVQGLIKINECVKNKSNEKAKQLRIKGNEAFQKKNFKLALNHYDEALLCSEIYDKSNECTENESNESALCLANRSAVYFHLNEFENCISDIDTALQIGYPESLQYKLHERRNKCQSMLIHSLNMLKHEQSDSRKNPNVIQYSHSITSSVASEYSNSLNGLSNKCDIVYTDVIGRHGIANQNINIGELIGKEKAHVSVVYLDYRKKICDNCLNPITIIYPCFYCTNVIYCSYYCNQKAFLRYHWAECGYLSICSEELLGCHGHLIIRYLLQHYVEFDDKNMIEENIDKLVSHEKKYPQDDQVSSCILSLIINNILTLMMMNNRKGKSINSTSFWVESAEMSTTILKLIYKFHSNTFAISKMNKRKNFQECYPSDIGQGFFLSLAMLNHSCDPNIEIIYTGNTAECRAIKNIEPGEEICIDYGVLFTANSLKDRQQYLETRYYFNCSCNACKYNWCADLDFETKNSGIICSCKFKQVISNPTKNIQCLNCKKIIAVKDIFDKLENNYEQYKKGLSLAFKWDLNSSLPILIEHLNMCQQYTSLPTKEFYSCQAVMKQILRLETK